MFAVTLPPPRKSFYGAVPRIFGSRCGAEPELVKLQFKQDVGVRTEVRGRGLLARAIDRASDGRLAWMGRLHSDGSLSRTVSLVVAQRCRLARSQAAPSFHTIGPVDLHAWPPTMNISRDHQSLLIAHYATTIERCDGPSTTASLWSGTILVCCCAAHVQDAAFRVASCTLRPFGNSI